jgi:hypothetical protein
MPDRYANGDPKVYLDVVVNHTGDVITLSNGGTYSDILFRDCRGKFFRADRFVTAWSGTCCSATTCCTSCAARRSSCTATRSG